MVPFRSRHVDIDVPVNVDCFPPINSFIPDAGMEFLKGSERKGKEREVFSLPLLFPSSSSSSSSSLSSFLSFWDVVAGNQRISERVDGRDGDKERQEQWRRVELG